MKPGDLIMYRDEKFGRHRFFEVEGVYLGAVGVTGLVGLRPLSEEPGSVGVGEGKPHAVMYVPEVLLRGQTVYEPVEP